MTMINKEKVLKGVGKAVDAANNAADKAAAFAKEKELDKKAKKQRKPEGSRCFFLVERTQASESA